MDLADTSVDQKKTQSGDFSFSRFFLRQAKQSDYSDVEKISTKFMRTCSDISSVREEMVSSSEIYSAVLGDEFVGDNGSLLSLQPWIFKREKSSKRVEESSDSSSRWSFDWGDFSWTPRGSPRRINPNRHSIGSKKRRQGGCNLRPVTFTDNFFAPHLRSENVGIEEHTFNFHPSLSVKDERLSCLIPGNGDDWLKVEQPESRSNNEFGSLVSSVKVSVDQLGGSVTEKLRTVMGVPHLPLRRPRKAEGNNGKALLGSLDASFSQKLDSGDGMFMFLLGVAIGATSNVASHRIEVEKLNKLLKDNKNLVQDLHEELEMKEFLTVKELANGTDGSEELERNNLHESFDIFQNQNSNIYNPAQKMDDCDNVCMTKVGKNLSEIEAELEAELERLEININASSREQRTRHLVEVDSELTVDVVSGGFREDLLVKCMAEDGKDATASSTTEAYDANYSVSPKELSLRLHKVIESRLEERIKELETELEQTQLKLKLVEAERVTSSKPPFSSSDAGSSNHSSPRTLNQKDSVLRSDLSGDALIAYDEAYEEFMRLADTEDEKLSYSICSEDKNLSKDCENDEACEQILWRSGSYDISATDDDDDGGGDNDIFFEGKDLIQKFLEKTKKGSPALLKAQKMFLMLDL
ncbi:hypothetical protein KSP39_PZI012098 [Platanthera zijinensis]|uniref:Uncharacterized protein n=1 Tax=Platanthera zijinensis TaxID=2320716 RepID=A0AAP0BFS9_9ASPA